MTISALLLASGRGTRLGAGVPKAYLRVGGRSLLMRSAARLRAACPDCELVIAVCADDRQRDLEPLLSELDALGAVIVDGGATRQESMERAFAACRPDAELIVVHDAARPFFPIEATAAALEAARDVGGALVALKAPDTVKRVGEDGKVIATLDRSEIWLAQTPQVARRELLAKAIELAHADGFAGTDDVSLLEHAGIEVAVVPGTPTNVKITTPDDLPLAEVIAAELDRTTEAG